MKKKVNDVERMADTIGLNLNAHLNFGISKSPSSLTSILSEQSSPQDVLDNVEKRI